MTNQQLAYYQVKYTDISTFSRDELIRILEAYDKDWRHFPGRAAANLKNCYETLTALKLAILCDRRGLNYKGRSKEFLINRLCKDDADIAAGMVPGWAQYSEIWTGFSDELNPLIPEPYATAGASPPPSEREYIDHLCGYDGHEEHTPSTANLSMNQARASEVRPNPRPNLSKMPGVEGPNPSQTLESVFGEPMEQSLQARRVGFAAYRFRTTASYGPLAASPGFGWLQAENNNSGPSVRLPGYQERATTDGHTQHPQHTPSHPVRFLEGHNLDLQGYNTRSHTFARALQLYPFGHVVPQQHYRPQPYMSLYEPQQYLNQWPPQHGLSRNIPPHGRVSDRPFGSQVYGFEAFQPQQPVRMAQNRGRSGRGLSHQALDAEVNAYSLPLADQDLEEGQEQTIEDFEAPAQYPDLSENQGGPYFTDFNLNYTV